VTRVLCYVGAFGFVCSVALVIIYHFGFRHPSITLFVPEAFKILLTFTLVALGGALIKGAIDASLDRERDKRARIEQRNERRSGILKEFSDIFSQFYSARKLYHSAKDHENIYDSNSTYYTKLIRELLRRSVDLEGRYGAVKILVIHHYHLPQNELSRKRMQELTLRVSKLKESVRENAEDERILIRSRLDLLGELYDEWRHALEENKKISDSVVGAAVWENYEALLKFLAKDEGSAASETASPRALQGFIQKCVVKPFARYRLDGLRGRSDGRRRSVPRGRVRPE
jgi:hypothetical protein